MWKSFIVIIIIVITIVVIVNIMIMIILINIIIIIINIIMIMIIIIIKIERKLVNYVCLCSKCTSQYKQYLFRRLRVKFSSSLHTPYD